MLFLLFLVLILFAIVIVIVVVVGSCSLAMFVDFIGFGHHMRFTHGQVAVGNEMAPSTSPFSAAATAVLANLTD